MPLRTCLVCRRRSEKRSLCRLVLVGAKLFYDHQYKAPGRGYYICRKTECLGHFFAGKRRFGRLPVGAEVLDMKSRALLQAECEKNN